MLNRSLDSSSIVSNLVFAFVAQGSSVAMSFITALLVPRVLGVAGYSYWQLFVFYSGYAGIFHFGISEGVYLINGGKTWDELDLESIGTQLKLSVVSQVIVFASILPVVLSQCNDSQRAFILCVTPIYIVLNNSAYYLGYVFQAVNETKLFSISIMVDRLAFLFPLILFLLFDVQDFRIYVVFYTISKAIALSYCAVVGRSVLLSRLLPFADAVLESWVSISIGIKLMLSNIMSSLVLGVARFSIDYKWGIESFGKLSFSLSMVNFFLQFVAQFSMVLFPALRRVRERDLKELYNSLNTGLSLMLPLIYLSYWPLSILVHTWLPSYASSVVYLSILLPVCIFDGRMNVCYSTFLKVMRRERDLLFINLASLITSALLVSISVFLLQSEILAICSIAIAIVFRSVLSEIAMIGILNVRFSFVTILEVLLAVCFAVSAYFFGPFCSLSVSLVGIGILYFLNWKSLSSLVTTLCNRH